MNHTDQIAVTTVVDTDPATAFEAFTEEVDAWWKQGPRFRPSVRGSGILHFESGVGGRLIETYDDKSTFVFGRVKVWEPGERLVFEMFARAFKPGESTEVEVRFEASGQRTRVTIVNRGWDRFLADHPVKHGLSEPAFNDLMSVWWADLLASIKNHIADSSAREKP
jgi:uncharacterized protein YndB with AHSA1/START domain